MSQTLNDRQRQQLSTCMNSCRNIAYPSLGLIEEAGEYIQKLIYMIVWNKDFPESERDHLLMLMRGIATSAYAIGRINKAIRHGEYPQPFTLRDFDDPDINAQRIEALQKELGDIDWMVNAAHFYTVFPAGTDPTQPEQPMTAQFLADQNYAKLAARRLQDTIDGKGDTIRTSI